MGDLFEVYDDNSSDGWRDNTKFVPHNQTRPKEMTEEEKARLGVEKLMKVLRSGTTSGAKSKMRALLASKIAPEAFYISTECYRIDAPTVSVVDATSLLKKAQVHVVSSRVPMINVGKPDQRPRYETCGDLVELPKSEIKHTFKAMRHDGNLNTLVLMTDDMRVAPAKGAQHYTRSKQSTNDADNYASELMANEHCTIAQKFGDRHYDKGYMFLTEGERAARIAELKAMQPKTPRILEDIERTTKCRPLTELLRSDALIPGRFETMMSDRTLGKPAVVRFINKALIFDPKYHLELEVGQRVILCGHGLFPEDLYNDEALDQMIAEEQGKQDPPLSAEEAYHRISYRVLHTPVLIFHCEDHSTVEEFFGIEARSTYEQSFEEEDLLFPNLRPVVDNPMPRYAVLDDFMHINGEVDQGAFFMIKKLSELPYNHSSFEYVTSDSDAVLTAGPFFYVKHFMAPLKEKKVAQDARIDMPRILNYYGTNPAKPQVCDIRLLMTEVTNWTRKLPYFAAQKLMITQTQEKPKDVFALLRPFAQTPEDSRRADAMIEIADKAANRRLMRVGANKDGREVELDVTIPICLHTFVALAIHYTDYSRSWPGLGPPKFVDALTNFSEQCMPLVEWSRLEDPSNPGKKMLQLIPGNALRFILAVTAHGNMAAFNTKELRASHRKSWPKGEKQKQNAGTVMAYHLPLMSSLEILQTISAFGEEKIEGLESMLRFPEECLPQDGKVLDSLIKQVSKLPKTTPELAERLSNFQYYLTMLYQTGDRYIRYPEETFHGYDARDPTRPIGPRNMRHAFELA